MSIPIIIEFGSHSLKVHYRSRSSGVFRKVRFVWTLGHEVYGRGAISKETAQKAVETILELRDKGLNPRSLLAIATGALRDAANRQEFLRYLEEKIGLHVRVISGREEASLLARGYLQHSSKLPAMLADIGGGSLEIVYLGKDQTILRDSLPLGAIRLHHLGEEPGKPWNGELVADWIASNFEEASVVTTDEIHATGGSAKAAAKVLGRDTFSREDLAALEERVRREGPPPELDEDRSRVFLPGLMVLRRLSDHCRASRIRYLKVSIGRIFLEKLAAHVRYTSSPGRKQYIHQNIRITSIRPGSSDK